MIPYKTDTDISSYIIFPRFLIPLDLSNDAKVLYALLLDRAGISRKKGYIEADGTIRLYFTVEDAKAKLRRSRQVTTRAFHELESCGLIVRRGRAHAAQPHDERQDQHQAEPSLFLHVLLLLWLEYYVYQKSTIFALHFQRFSPVLSKY